MNLFKSKKSEPAPQPGFETMYDPFRSSREALNNYLTSNIGKSGPKYGKERVAGLAPLEEKSLDAGAAYAEKPTTGANYAAASQEIQRTLSGEYDPSTSPYYQAVKAEAERNLEKTNERIKHSTSGGRRFFSGLREQLESEAATDVNIDLNKTLGTLAENERGRMMQAIPYGLAAEKQEDDAYFNKATGLQQIGALPRELRQADLDAMYDEFVNSEYNFPLNIAQLASGPGQQEPIFVQTGYTRRQPSFTSQLLSLFS